MPTPDDEDRTAPQDQRPSDAPENDATDDETAESATPETDAAEEDAAGTKPDRAPLGGDETTQNQLVAENPAEEATLAALDPESPPA